MDKGRENLTHALTNNCEDLDCEIHNPDVGIQEGTVSLTNLAFFVAGACKASEQLLNEVKVAFRDILQENFLQYHEEALNVRSGLDAAQHHELEDR